MQDIFVFYQICKVMFAKLLLNQLTVLNAVALNIFQLSRILSWSY